MDLALFDFDGTVTSQDSFTPFVYFAAGRARIIAGSVVLSPLIIGYKLGLVPTPRMRAAVAYVCFKNRKVEEVGDLGQKYAETLDRIVRPEAMDRIHWHQARGDRVVIVSASLAPYLRFWCAARGLELICTELEARTGTLTGRYLGGDCTGGEKAKRVATRYVLSSYSEIYAYGDTQEDLALLRLASQPHFRGRAVTRESLERHVPFMSKSLESVLSGRRARSHARQSSSMPVILRRIALALLVLAAGGVLLFGLHYFRFGYGQCHPHRSVVSDAERREASRSLPGLSEVSVSASDGVTLRGWYVPPKNGVVIVLVHGLFSNRAGLLPDAEVLARHGYGALLFDSRAHGESGGDAATWGSLEANDLAAETRFVRAQPGVTGVGVLGFSVGASAVARAAADDPSIRAVILYATWTSLREEIAYKTERGGWLGAQCALLGFRVSGTQIDAIRPEADLAQIAPRPLLLVSGGRDTDTPPWVMDRMFAAARGQKQWWREPEVGHGGYVQGNPLEYERRVIAFLDRAFQP